MASEFAPHDAFLAEIIGTDDNEPIGPAASKILSETTAEFQRGLTLNLRKWDGASIRITNRKPPKSKAKGDLIRPELSFAISPVKLEGRTYKELKNCVNNMAHNFSEGRDIFTPSDCTNEGEPSFLWATRKNVAPKDMKEVLTRIIELISL